MAFTFERKWCMPNAATFQMRPIRERLESVIKEDSIWIDPFVRNSIVKDKMTYTNDLNEDFSTIGVDGKPSHMDGILFLETIPDNFADGVLFDPPYTVHQVCQIYQGVGGPVRRKQAAKAYDEITRILKPNGLLITFGFNTNGPGKKRGFELEHLMDLCHGGSHNDTLVATFKKL